MFSRAQTVHGAGLGYSLACFSPKHVGAGSFYLLTMNDKAGRVFDGGANGRLTVPANASVMQYWSATVYDRATHALIRDWSGPSRSSQIPGLQTNETDPSDTTYPDKEILLAMTTSG